MANRSLHPLLHYLRRVRGASAGASMVQIENIFYGTTAENAKHLREEQAQIDAKRAAKAMNE